MRKLFSVLIAAALLLSLISCTQRPEPEVLPEALPEPETLPEPESGVSSPEMPDTLPEEADEPAAETNVPTQEAPAAESDAAAISILGEIYEHYYPGTAGCSLRAAACAGKLLDWYAAHGTPESAAGSGANFAAVHDLSPEAVGAQGVPVDFPGKFEDIYSSAMSLAFGNTQVLMDAGYTPQESWSAVEADTLFKKLYEGLGLGLPERVKVYFPDANAECFLTAEIPGACSEYTVLGALKTAGVVSRDVELLGFSQNGETLTLDFSAAFGAAMQSTGTTGEYMLLGSLVNTYLDAFGAQSLSFTVEGAVLETGHSIYDFPLSHFEDNLGQ